jgi:hypothetical protein
MSDQDDRSQPIEYRQLFARMYAVRVKHGKFFTDRAAEFLQHGQYENALADLKIAQSFFPDNEKLPALLKMVKARLKTAGKGGVFASSPEPPAFLGEQNPLGQHAMPVMPPAAQGPPRSRPSMVFGQAAPMPASPPAPLDEPTHRPAFWIESSDE